MNKEDFLRSLDVLAFCSFGNRNPVLKNFKSMFPKNYSPNLNLCISYLGLKETLSELGLSLPELTSFLFKDDSNTAIRYLSIVLERGYDRFFLGVLSLSDRSISQNSNKEIKSILTNEFENLTSAEDVVIFYYTLIFSNGGSRLSPLLLDTIKTTCRTSLGLIKSKSIKSSWYCSVTVKNNYQEITKLKKRKKELEELLRR